MAGEKGFDFGLEVVEDGVDDLGFGGGGGGADELEHQWIDLVEICVGQEGCEVLSVRVLDGWRVRWSQVGGVEEREERDDQGRLG